MRRFLTILLLTGLSVLGVVGSSPASAQAPSTIEITSAALVARGAAVEITYTLTCEAGASAFYWATVTQRVGSRVAQGTAGTFSERCTGSAQTLTSLVTAYSAAAFRKGTALVQTYVDVCGLFGCEYLRPTDVVEIEKG